MRAGARDWGTALAIGPGLVTHGAARFTKRIFGAASSAALPERARLRFLREQATSEIIVGWIQAAAIVFFAFVYAISPKAFPPGTRFEPVPWTLAVYGVFTAGRIVLAYRRRLCDGLVTLSIVIDVAVLMITIWSFHLQYRAPAALYLKAPTLMYVFILIALRTLRFDPRYVVIAGGCSAAGWLALFLYAAVQSGEGALGFTHNYVEYATSYKILRGAEVDKILSILIVTAILALSLRRARNLLANSVAEEIAAADFARFFPPEVAEQLRSSDVELASGQGLRRTAAVLSIDLRGFTRLSQDMSAADLIELLGEYQSALVPVVQRRGGRIDKYLGDGILASFGAVAPSTTYAADLLRAIEDLTATANRWRSERTKRHLVAPAIGVAGCVGEVVFGIIGHDSRLEYTVIGEVVNIAVKLEKHTKREYGLALTTRQAFDVALAQGYRPRGLVSRRPGQRVQGLAKPMDLVALAPWDDGDDA